MNKLVIAIIIIAILVLGAYFFLDIGTDNAENTLEQIPDSEFPNLDTNDQVLDEIDSAFENLG